MVAILEMKILHLCNKEYWNRKVPRTRFHAIDALSKISEVHNTGLGFSDWDSRQGVKQNIEAMPFDPDWIIVYKPDQYNGWFENRIPVAQAFNDCWATEDRINNIITPDTRLVIMHHANEMDEWQNRFPEIQFVNIPYPINPEIFYDRKQEKTVDILLTGAIDKNIYPLRHRFAKLIASGAFKPYHAVHRKHSGHRS